MTELKVNDSCIGCGMCISRDEEHFTFDDEKGTSKVISQENLDNNEELESIVEDCPVSAIELK